MVRRLVILGIAGAFLAFTAIPASGQSRNGEIWVIDDDFLDAIAPAQPSATTPPPPKRPQAIPPKNPLKPQVWKTLAPFKDESEFNAFRARAAEVAKSRRWTWGFLRQRMAAGPLLAQEFEPCDPAIQECPDSLDEVSVTGMRATTQQSITNNQVSGVDEGDIVKAFDRFLVVLMHGRLFSVDLGAAPGQMRLIDRVDAYDKADDESWIDEILIHDDVILVTGYSYETDSSNISLYRIDTQGHFSFLSRYNIESDDYYSWENYATRIVDGKLVIYTPFDLSEYATSRGVPLPRIRRFTQGQGFSEWQPLFGFKDVYRPIQPAIYPNLHVISVCPIDPRAALKCESRGIVGPSQQVMYVAPDHAYLWLASDRDEAQEGIEREECTAGQNVFRKRGSPSAAYRLTVSTGALGAVHTEGWPSDQFSLEEKGSQFWALVRRPPLACDAEDAEGDEYEPLALLNIDAGQFSTRPGKLGASGFFDVPTVGSSWGLNARFAEKFLLYGAQSYDWDDDGSKPAQLVSVPLFDPSRFKQVRLTHGLSRLELFGNNAVAFGTKDSDLAVTSIRVALRPSLVDTQIVPGAEESEGRSHAFNSLANKDGSGMFGLPIVIERSYRRDNPTYVRFFTADRNLQLDDADQLAGSPESEGALGSYECQVSCYDWYGNSRPIFYRGRVFALIGSELIEGRISDKRISEIERVNLTGPRAYAR